MFAIFDLDGFKAYNDSFGHAAGDLLLQRLGRNLARLSGPYGVAYRLGGDEFCVMSPESGVDCPTRSSPPPAPRCREEGAGFSIGSSCGAVMLPSEAANPSEALRIADRRMYAEKGRRESSAERQTRDVLLRILREREPELGEHLQGVARLAMRAREACSR